MSGKVESCASNSYALLTLTCDVCHKYFNGSKPYNEHLQSNNHKKRLKEKTLLNVASQENIKTQATNLPSDAVYKYEYEDLNIKKKAVDDFQYRKLSGCEKSNTLSFDGWKPIEISASPTTLFTKSVKESKQFYVECAVCQLYFTSEKSAAMHFNSDEHRNKEAHHREIEELYNSIKNVDIQEIVDNLLYEAPSLSTLENNVMNFQADEIKLPFSDGKTEKLYSVSDELKLPYSDCRTKRGADKLKLPLSDGRTREKLYPGADELKLPLSGGRTKEILYPGCEVCGISSFCSVISSLNHLTTAEHCRRAAVQAEAARLSSKISNELPLASLHIDLTQKTKENNYEDITAIPPCIISLNSDFYSIKQEQSNSNNIPLNPIGYERKQKHKQRQQSDVSSIEEFVYLPDNYNVGCDGKASSSTAQCFSEVLLNPLAQEYKSSTNNDMPSINQTASRKCASKKPFPRLAATFPQNDINIQQNNLSGIKIFGSNQDLF